MCARAHTHTHARTNPISSCSQRRVEPVEDCPPSAICSPINGAPLYAPHTPVCGCEYGRVGVCVGRVRGARAWGSPRLLRMTQFPMSQPCMLNNHCTWLSHKHMVTRLALPRPFAYASTVSWHCLELWGATLVELVLLFRVLLEDMFPALRRAADLGFEIRNMEAANVTSPLPHHIQSSSLLRTFVKLGSNVVFFRCCQRVVRL